MIMKKNILLFFVFIHLIMNAQTKELWGMTMQGGTGNNGVIFKTNSNANSSSLQIVKDFDTTSPGANPDYTHLTETSDGKFYGTTSKGGKNGYGVIFQYDPVTNISKKKYDFPSRGLGSGTNSSLLLASNGKLYGTAAGGDVFTGDSTSLYEYDPSTEVFKFKIFFDSYSTSAGDLIQASNGKIYGVYKSGSGDALYEYNISTNILSKKVQFTGAQISPTGLIVGENGKLYGTRSLGGINNVGVLYEYDTNTDIYTKKIDFNTTDSGANPRGNLYRAPNNKLYGVTKIGGINNLGVIFEYDILSNTIVKKNDFNGTEGGALPIGSFVSSNNKLYGVTEKGGSNNLGVLFEYDLTSNLFTKRVDFDGVEKGSLPYSSLAFASDGFLYGMTNMGGSGAGVLYKYDPVTNIYSKKFNFNQASDGIRPYGSLLQASNYKIYGLTAGGGSYNKGTMFEYDLTNKVYTKKYDFNDDKGSSPKGSLIQTSDGKLYGMTQFGGAHSNGVIFEYDIPTNTYTKKFDFDGTNGKNPYGDLLESSVGTLYGMTYAGGVNDLGILFEFNPITNTIIKKLDFDGSNSGKNPYGSLIKATNGKLYGMTYGGGTNNYGLIFGFDPSNNSYTKLYEFLGTANDGNNPRGSLIQATNGKLYGMSAYNGYYGVLFQYDLSTNVFKKDYQIVRGSEPFGSLMQASNGNIYGMTSYGSVGSLYYFGGIFEYNLLSPPLILPNNIPFYSTGYGPSFPYFTKLIEVSYDNLATNEVEKNDVLIYPNPAKNSLFIKSKDIILGYEIYSLEGRKLLSKEQKIGLDNIDVSKLSVGNYLLKLKMQKGEKTFKFIKN